MEVKYNLEKIKSFIKDLCEVTGASMAVYDTEMRMIYQKQKRDDRFCQLLLGCKEGADRCRHSDMTLLNQCATTGVPQSHICHAGLIDTAVPIKKDSITVGYFVIGRVRPTKEFTDDLIDRLSWCDISPIEMRSAYDSLTYFTQQQLDCLVNLLLNLFIDSAISIEYSDTLSAAIEYINNNLHRRLSVTEICEKCYVSKNRLYEAFRNNLNTTINDYIVARKLERAKSLLTGTDKSIAEISDEVAVGDYTYFCKLFKCKCGVSPKSFRDSSRR